MARILVVDDEESIRLSLRQFLADAGYEADSAEAVDEAMGMLAAEEFDVVVSDIIMPRLTGVALLEAIKATSPEVEVILMTGEPTVDTASQAVRSGAFDYLAKPIGKDEFLKTVANAVRVKDLGDERRRLAEENRQYQDNLEELIQTRTKALYDSEERMTLALQGADLATWDWDVKTDSIIRNKRWSEMLGYEEGEIDESLELFTDLVHPDDRQFSWDALDAHLEGKTDSFEAEHRMRHKSGGWVWVLDRGRVLEWDLDGKPLRICGTHLDITKRREAEQQLRQAQKMEAIGELTGGMAHDFNNFLTSIRGNLQLVNDELGEDFGEEITAPLNDALSVAGEGVQLIARLLAFSRGQELAPVTLRPNDLISTFHSVLKGVIKAGVDLQLDLSEDASTIVADSNELRSALLNLCLNAREAMPAGGSIVVATRIRSVGPGGNKALGLEPGDYLALSVSDTGVGISAENLSRLVEPFFTTKAFGNGSGLGLSMVHGFVAQSGGSLQIESEVGKGSTMTMLIPSASSAHVRQAPMSAVSSPAPRGVETILVVDDDAWVRRFAVRALTSLGYRTIDVDSAAMALDEVARNAVDLLFSDIVMPGGINGHELAALLSETNPELKVLLTTGFNEEPNAGNGTGG